VGCSRTIDGKELVEKSGLKYKVHKEKPYTGKVVSKYENGQKLYDEMFKDGKPDGKWTWWNENGKKWAEGTY
jgi:antitoxin component YwqK of YwqJK toxin-antitoxin module|tara:strand:+ start:114 stop:329 length:216 start_codon:yes stop_codon:yes gene_type:complete